MQGSPFRKITAIPIHTAKRRARRGSERRNQHMSQQENVYILGHKNPDTDSICSAIAYADIRNSSSKWDAFVPRPAVQINEETESVLKRISISHLGYMPNVGSQV